MHGQKPDISVESRASPSAMGEVFLFSLQLNYAFGLEREGKQKPPGPNDAYCVEEPPSASLAEGSAC